VKSQDSKKIREVQTQNEIEITLLLLFAGVEEVSKEFVIKAKKQTFIDGIPVEF
jgi:hypothetical protein